MRHSDTQCISFWQLSVRCQKIYHVAPEMRNSCATVHDVCLPHTTVFWQIISISMTIICMSVIVYEVIEYYMEKYGSRVVIYVRIEIMHFWSYMVYLLTPYWKLSKTNTLSIRMSHFVLKNVLYTNLYSKSPFH